jgi:hypothetical protein
MRERGQAAILLVGVLLAVVVGGLDLVGASVRTFSPATAAAIAGLTAILRAPSIDPAAIAAISDFSSWFGRGQQYLSFSRRGDAKGAPTNDRCDD